MILAPAQVDAAADHAAVPDRSGHADAHAGHVLAGEAARFHIFQNRLRDIGNDIDSLILGAGGNLPALHIGAVHLEKTAFHGGPAHVDTISITVLGHCIYPFS